MIQYSHTCIKQITIISLTNPPPSPRLQSRNINLPPLPSQSPKISLHAPTQKPKRLLHNITNIHLTPFLTQLKTRMHIITRQDTRSKKSMSPCLKLRSNGTPLLE